MVTWQPPNLPISAWAIAKLFSYFTDDIILKEGLAQVSVAFLLTWAILELLQGVNYFRQILGSVVLLGILMRLFA